MWGCKENVTHRVYMCAGAQKMGLVQVRESLPAVQHSLTTFTDKKVFQLSIISVAWYVVMVIIYACSFTLIRPRGFVICAAGSWPLILFSAYLHTQHSPWKKTGGWDCVAMNTQVSSTSRPSLHRTVIVLTIFHHSVVVRKFAATNHTELVHD